MRVWYLSLRRTAKAQTRLRIHVISPEPLLFAHMNYGSRRWMTKNQTSSPTGWLRMRIWRMNLRRTKSAKISWLGSYIVWTAMKRYFFSTKLINSDSICAPENNAKSKPLSIQNCLYFKGNPIVEQLNIDVIAQTETKSKTLVYLQVCVIVQRINAHSR